MPFDPTEQDVPPLTNTFRKFTWSLLTNIVWARAFFGRRLFGVFAALADDIAATATQAFFARLPGHPQQAPDSLEQSGFDRGLVRFRGETDAAWKSRVQSAWDDYAQAGTDIQMKRVINQWGNAGWPSTWNNSAWTLAETSGVGVFKITLVFPWPLMSSPSMAPWLLGGGHILGESGLYLGIGASTDLAMLFYLIRKWKPSRTVATVTVFWSASDSVTFTVR